MSYISEGRTKEYGEILCFVYVQMPQTIVAIIENFSVSSAVDLPRHIKQVSSTSSLKAVKLDRIMCQYANLNLSPLEHYISCFPQKVVTLLDVF